MLPWTSVTAIGAGRGVVQSILSSGKTILSILSVVTVAPVVAAYMLVDWDRAIDRIDGYAEELTAIRRDLHAHPEIGFEEVRTSGIVAEKLASYGIEVHRGIGTTGVGGRGGCFVGDRLVRFGSG